MGGDGRLIGMIKIKLKGKDSLSIYILISDINVFCQCFFSRETLNSNRSKPSQEGVACFFLEVRR